ncbi:MAG: leucine-rich repeat domain-containing protein, partial [Bacteroidales bacterium]|nr:leucine-rich repeat domain-containing protein [Candidatus Colicola coprequi]
MKTKLLSLFVALIATSALWASNTITYTATEKLDETTDQWTSGLHTNTFNVSIASHTFTNGMGTITFDGEITTIGYGAFRDCSGLTSVTIPSSVTTIGIQAFNGCNSLPVEDNLRYADTYLVEAVDRTLSKYTIKEGTKWIGNYALSGCKNLTSVTIPNSVTTIGYAAFANCTGLPSVIIPNSVTTIEDYAFFLCSSLTSVTIGNFVTSIREGAFAWCSNLTSITCEAITPPTCGGDCFKEVNHSIPLYVSAASIDAYKAADEWKDFTNIQAIPTTTSITLYDRPTGEQTWQQAAEHLQAQLTDLKNKCDADPTLTCDVRIVRTIAHNGVLTPICLPFSLSADEISNASSPLHQAYIYSFDCRAQKNSDEVEVRMRRQNHIIAGVPYVIKFTQGNDQDYFDFKDVRITVDEPLTDESTAMNFVGNFLPIPLESSENILYVTTDGSLCWWDSSIDDGVTYLRGFRAHFV